MLKTIALMKRKPGISREEFARHYEEVHAPLAVRLLPMMKHYARNHIVAVVAGAEPEFDCLSEFRFDSLDDAMKLMETVESEAGRPIREDEPKFLDRDSTVSYVVDEKASELAGQAEPGATVKAVALLRMKSGLSRQDFAEHYEQVHASLIVKHSVGLVRYVRNHVQSPEGAPGPELDCITELWYADREAYQASMANRLGAARAVIEEDEQSFIDTGSIVFLLVDERVSK